MSYLHEICELVLFVTCVTRKTFVTPFHLLKCVIGDICGLRNNCGLCDTSDLHEIRMKYLTQVILMAPVIHLFEICDLHEIQYLHKMHEPSARHVCVR